MLSVERAGAGRTVLVEPVEREGACPDCGVLSSRIRARPVHRVRDVQCGGEPLEVRVRKRRLACLEPPCPRRSFVQTTDEIPLRSRLTSRLVAGIVADLSAELLAVSRVAAASGVSWTTAMRVMEDTAVLDGGVDRRLVRRLGVDEHRFRRVRYLKNDAGKVTRIEPWSIVFMDLDTGAVLDIVDGRRGQAVRDWIGARPRWWRNKVELVAMDMSSEFRRAVRKVLPKAAITVDHWHVVARSNQMVTEVRRRRAHDLHGRRGRATDPAWKYRKLLTCNQETCPPPSAGGCRKSSPPTLNLVSSGHQGTCPPAAEGRSYRRLPPRLGRTGKRREGDQNAGGEVTVPDTENVAQRAAHVLPDPGHKCAQRGGEPQRQEPQMSRPRLPES